jgi:predicted  nucleic acid-binding Zn-ribbon protein
MLKKITERIFPFLIALSALSVSASAAFYSISGLSKLFAGAAFAVIVMAASLEIAKLVIASLLYQYRKTLPFLLKAYLSIACVVLILITSMGIYGFLSSAYQDTANKEGNIEARIVLIETKRNNVKEQLEVYTEEKASINEAVSELRKGLSNNKVQWKDRETGQIITSTSSSTRKALEKQLDQAIERQTEINGKVDNLNEKIFEYETEIVDARIGDGSTSELGPLKYLSGLTGMPMDKIINYLLLTIIFVFDPLAIALVIAANFAFARLRKPTKENLYGEVVEIDGDDGIKVECSVPEGKEFNTPYDISDIIADEEKKVENPPPPLNEAKIEALQQEIQKIHRQDNSGKKASLAVEDLSNQIKKLKKDDEENQITY